MLLKSTLRPRGEKGVGKCVQMRNFTEMQKAYEISSAGRRVGGQMEQAGMHLVQKEVSRPSR